ncbi:MAG: aldo/keto reductase [Candidatus Micrarchaeota archaeon]|nr:aldo/keto reductase [Candidatus Micrarchaeota archaeon]
MMRHKTLGDTGERLSEIGIGTWKMGINPEKETLALQSALDDGINLIDTAEMYATEAIVAKAVEARKGVFIATKVSPNHFKYNDLINSCDASLRRLAVGQIDLYQLHWPNHRISIKETMRAMEDLAEDGKIRHIGVSNFSVNELIEAQTAMDRYEIVSNQVEYSVLTREIEEDLLDFCEDNKITIIAYSPFGTGLLFDNRYRKTFDALDMIGKRHNKTAVQVALNWLTSKKGVIAIPKTSDLDHVNEIIGASGWKLSKSEINEINSLSQRKAPLGGFLKPVLKGTSMWAGAMQSFNEKRIAARQNRNTAMSSKK